MACWTENLPVLMFSSASATWRPYRTSDADGETLKPLDPCSGEATLAPRSVTTFVGVKS